MRIVSVALAAGLLMVGTSEGWCWDNGRAAHEQGFVTNFVQAAGAQIDTAGNILDHIEAHDAPRLRTRHRRWRHAARWRHARPPIASCRASVRVEVC